MYTYPESMTVVARYLLPELHESACCLHCRQKLHIVNPVAIHRLCGIVLCESCFSKALIDYHSSPLVGRAPPFCPSCHHSLTEENLNLTFPPLRYAVEDSLSHLTSQRWQEELERQQAQQAQNFSNSYGFGQVYEPVLFGGRNAVGEEFMVLPDGTAVRAHPTLQPLHYAQLEQKIKDLEKYATEGFDEVRRWRDEKDSYWTGKVGNNDTPPWYRDNNGYQNQGQNNWQGNKGKGKHGRKGNHNNHNKNNNQNQNQNPWGRKYKRLDHAQSSMML
jgi:hypothetical protein